jgi:hypothetical protein
MNRFAQQPQEDEEETDYDPFAEWRPSGMDVNDNLSDQLAGEDLEDVDEFAEFRTQEEETQEPGAAKPERKFSTAETIKDVAKQGVKEFLIGLGGTYGDLTELAGVRKQSKEQEEKNVREFQTLQKMEQPGYEPSFLDFMSISSDDEFVPASQRLPSSEDLREISKGFGGPGEAETAAGRYAGRFGKLYGSGLALGQASPTSAFLGSLAGQTAEELGAGPLTQAAAEIAGMLASPQGGIKKLVGSNKKEVSNLINQLRELGYSEQDITLAINRSSKGRKFGIKASKSESTEQAFENFAKHSDVVVKDILQTQIPGYEKGVKHVHQMASDAYGKVAQDATKLGIKNLDPFFNTVDNTIKEANKLIGHNAEAKSFIKELTQHMFDVIDNPSADKMIDFYQKLNGIGKWVGRNQKDRIITNVKNSIKDTFKAEGKQGQALAENFEKVNAGIQQAYRAERVSKIMRKANTQNGFDYKALSKKFDDTDTVALFQDVLGKKQADNLQMIAKTGREVKDFDKSYKAASLLTDSPIALGSNIGYQLYTGGWGPLSVIKGMEGISRKLAEKSLTDPNFQNLLIRGLHAIKVESPKLLASANAAMQKYLKEEGINVDLGAKD